MAEFCLECLNKINETNDSKWRYVLSWEKELCEECGQYKHVMIVERRWSRLQKILKEAIENFKNR
jgi:hypothetical protein